MSSSGDKVVVRKNFDGRWFWERKRPSGVIVKVCFAPPGKWWKVGDAINNALAENPDVPMERIGVSPTAVPRGV